MYVFVKVNVLPDWETKVAPVTDLEVTLLLSVATTEKVTVCVVESVVSVIESSSTVNELIAGASSSFLVTLTERDSVAVFPCESVTVAV